MRKIVLLAAFLLAAGLFPSQSLATEKSPATSAKLQNTNIVKINTDDPRVLALTAVLKRYDSPLIPYAKAYVDAADKYGVDWRLLPSISGIESYFGTMMIDGTHNAYGWGGGYIYFKNWEDGIDAINRSLRQDYMDKWGVQSVWEIGPIYAEASHWSTRVADFMDEMNREYVRLTSENLAINL